MKIVKTSLEGLSLILFALAIYTIVAQCIHKPETEVFRANLKYQEDEHITTDEARLMMLKWEEEKLRAEIRAKNEE